MKVTRLTIKNFRGIFSANLLLPDHGVLVGDNNTGKTTILEALDLVLGPDRLNRQPPIEEHDFYRGVYFTPRLTESDDAAGDGQYGSSGGDSAADKERIAEGDSADLLITTQRPPRIEIEVLITDLSELQRSRFWNEIEFWDTETATLYDQPDPSGVDANTITEALRVTFHGWYDPEDDDFVARTYFTRSLIEGDEPAPFSRKDKQVCGFLYLRSLRTGTRALSLERGSMLDIILRLKEVRPRMWESTIATLAGVPVAADPDLGIAEILGSIERALTKYVPKEWGINPHLRVSNLTREHLRKVISAFIATGEGSHAAPFYRQGTGTINMLVLAMLTQIAEDKQNVIFAMEEPETAVPPYAQKRIVHEVRRLASQTLFTSHSPYVMEVFELSETLVLSRNAAGVLSHYPITLPKSLKLKRYRQEFRTRFCEGLLSRRVLIVEGATEAQAFPAVCRRLAELRPETYSSLEALGICTLDAGTDSQIADLGRLYRQLGKQVFGFCDHQTAEQRVKIETEVDLLLMHAEHGFEDQVLKNTAEAALRRFAAEVDWPPHLRDKFPNPESDIRGALRAYLRWEKANWSATDLLVQCNENEMPPWLKDACTTLKHYCSPSVAKVALCGTGEGTTRCETTSDSDDSRDGTD